ncbi:MAG: DUF2283 domain-containing protein [Verrucomicrobiota bacterium]
MIIRYDPEADALSILFRETTVTTQNVQEGVAVELDQDGHLAGIEILDAVKRLGGRQTLQQVTMEQVATGTV